MAPVGRHGIVASIPVRGCQQKEKKSCPRNGRGKTMHVALQRKGRCCGRGQSAAKLAITKRRGAHGLAGPFSSRFSHSCGKNTRAGGDVRLGAACDRVRAGSCFGRLSCPSPVHGRNRVTGNRPGHAASSPHYREKSKADRTDEAALMTSNNETAAVDLIGPHARLTPPRPRAVGSTPLTNTELVSFRLTNRRKLAAA